MFKTLREKITTADQNNRKKASVNNNNSVDYDNPNDFSKNSDSQGLFRFSSLSSLASDLGSAFSKTMTAPLHVQPFNPGQSLLYDSESISEYDDSTSVGDTLTKEELFQRYQRAKLFAKRYKTRYLEVVECYRKIESDNNKLTQALTDTQDKQFRRVNELKEQIELDRKAKIDIEDNYTLMIEEKAELINVLKLQVNLLKEGKDLPPELEEQIKHNHEKAVQFEKKKDDEIKELKQILSQRDNLLQRCKDKINSLNSQLNELKMKASNVQDISASNDDTTQQLSDKMPDTDAIEKEYNERIKNILIEFEEKKSQYETEIEQRNTSLKMEGQQMKDKIKNLCEENESLLEQINIKTNIIQDLMKENIPESNDNWDLSAMNSNIQNSVRLCQLIINTYPDNIQPLIDELSLVLHSIQFNSTTEMTDSHPSDEFTEQITSIVDNENSRIKDLDEENKFLLTKIEQLEKVKLNCEEENLNRERELSELNSIIDAERKDHCVKFKSLEGEINSLQIELAQCKTSNEKTLQRLSELQLVLAKTEEQKIAFVLEKEVLLKNYQSLEETISSTKSENNNLLQELHTTCNECSELETRLTAIRKEHEMCQNNLTDKTEQCKSLKDKIDELMTSLDNLNNEKSKLLIHVNDVQDNISSKDEQLSLNVVEMQQRFDQEILDLKDQLKESNDLNEEKSAKILTLEQRVQNLLDEMDKYRNLNDQLSELTRNIEDQLREKEKLLENLEILTQQNNSMKSQLNEMETEKHSIKQENSTLLARLNKEDNILAEMKSIKIDNQNLITEANRFQKEKEELINNLSEIKMKFDHEIQEKSMISDDLINKIKSLESSQTGFNEMMLKHESLIQEIESLNQSLILSQGENEILKSELIEKSSNLNQEKNTLLQDFNKCKEELFTIQQSELISKEVLKDLNEEINELRAKKLVLEDHVGELMKASSLIEKEKTELRQLLSESLSHAKHASEDIEKEKTEILEGYIRKIQDYEVTIAQHEETARSMEKSLHTKNERLDAEINMKNEFITTIDHMESCFPKFCDWVENVTALESCDGQCKAMIDPRPVYWTTQLETEYNSYKSLTSVGHAFDKVLLLCHGFHSRLHEIRTNIEKCNNSQMDNENLICNIKKELEDICIELNIDSNDKNEHDKLIAIRNAVETMKYQLEEKTIHSLQIESQCSQLIESLNTHDANLGNVCHLESPLRELEMKFNHLIQSNKQDLMTKEEVNKNVQGEFDKISVKLEKSNKILLNMFKQLIIIFHFTDINVTDVTDINKSSCSKMIKGLKDYIKQRDQLNNEYQLMKGQLDKTEKELKTTMELNYNIKTELDDLKKTVSNDRNRLIATSEELEMSMRRLNEVADEKGRIDEEKQSLRKELKELNDKISNLKLEFENQSLEKQRLEMQFDESLNKVRSNHTALEETYKKELEKQHGYQRNLEEQMAIHKQSSSLKLSDSERKLEEVLCQSEQLLELNHQYKKLLDDAKLKADKVGDEYTSLQNQKDLLQSQFDQLSSENKTFIETIEDLHRIQNEISLERDSLKDFKALKESTDDDLENVRLELNQTKLLTENLKATIKNLENSHEEMVKKEKSLVLKSCEMATQENDYKTNVTSLQKKLDEMEIKYHEVTNEKNDLHGQLRKLQDANNQSNLQNEEIKKLMRSYKNQIEDINLEMEQMKTRHDIEKDELEQQFAEEKSNLEEDLNRKVKKLAKEFNDKIYTKEKDFQKTFEEALNTIRNDEGRLKNDLRATIDELNRSVIELEMDKNQLLDSLSENEVKLKNWQKQIESKEIELQSAIIKAEELSNLVHTLENEKQVMSIDKISKMNQTVDSSTSYEDMFLDSVGIKDHEVLLMHCTDIEEQLKQLQAENINLKRSAIVNSECYSLDNSHENIISSVKIKPLSNQLSMSSDPNKTPNLYHGGILRSPNMSISDYNFCPLPITEATDYEYLHDVLLKYMTGMETEILAKVVCTVMKFSHEETNRVLIYEQDRNKFIRRII